MAERGKVDYDQIRVTARNGQGTQVQMFGGGSVAAGHVAVFNGNGDVVDGGASGGAVTSVGLAMPPEFSVSGSPVISAGTLAVSKAGQAKNLVYASPVSGSGVPVFRALALADMPAGVGAVASVFGRTGAVVAQAGDYAVAQVTGAAASATTITAGAGLTGGGDLSANRTFAVVPATASALGGVKIGANISVAADGTISVAAPGSGAVTSVFGRSGAVVAASGDYTAAQVTNAVSTAGSYADPPWITSLAWSKITGAPAGGSQTPWLQNVDAAGFTLANVPSISASAALTLAAGGAGSLTLQTNALTRVTVNSSGNVGIGTASPWARLAVNGGTAYDASVTYQASASFAIVGSSGELAAGQATASPNAMWLQSRQSTNAALALILNPMGGAVGIGVVPGPSLTIKQTANAIQGGLGLMSATDNNMWNIWNSSGYSLSFGINTNAAALLILSNGAISMPSLPSANPGAGTKQLWYDPADSNRLKFAA